MSVGDHWRTYGEDWTLDSSSISKCSHDTAESCHGKHLHTTHDVHTHTHVHNQHVQHIKWLHTTHTQWHCDCDLPVISSLLTTTLCLKKNIPDVFSYNLRKHWRIFIIFGRNVTEKASNHMFIYCYNFPPHLINASTLPCKTENTEIVSFHVNAACWFASRHTSHIGIIT